MQTAKSEKKNGNRKKRTFCKKKRIETKRKETKQNGKKRNVQKLRKHGCMKRNEERKKKTNEKKNFLNDDFKDSVMYPCLCSLLESRMTLRINIHMRSKPGYIV